MIDAINKTIITQKKIPIMKKAPTCCSGLLNGTKVKMKKEKKSATKVSEKTFTPQYWGPNGVIHNCPDHVAKNTMTKNNQKPRNGLFENAESIQVIKIVTNNDASIT